MEHRNDAEIATKVREALEASGVPIRTLAHDTGITERTLHRRLAGEKPWLAKEVARIAARLGRPVSDFMSD